jgi:hypothetical protein
MAPIEMPTDEHAQAGAAAQAPVLGDLQHEAAKRDGVVPRDDAFFLVTEDLFEGRARPRARRRWRDRPGPG